MNDKCAFPGCRSWSTITYLTCPLCDDHWSLVADDNYKKSNRVLKKLGLPPREKFVPKDVIREAEIESRLPQYEEHIEKTLNPANKNCHECGKSSVPGTYRKRCRTCKRQVCSSCWVDQRRACTYCFKQLHEGSTNARQDDPQ